MSVWATCPRCGKDVYNSHNGWRDHDEKCEASPVIEGDYVIVDEQLREALALGPDLEVILAVRPTIRGLPPGRDAG